MRKKSSSESGHNPRSMRIFLLFCLVVFLLIGTSLAVKFFHVLQNSRFDGKHRFTLLIQQEDTKAELLSFSPLSQTMTRISIRSDKKLPDVGKQLGIAVDGKIADSRDLPASTELAPRLLAYSTKLNKNNITSLDFIRLSFFANSLTVNDIEERKLSDITNTEETDQELALLFLDQTLQDEKLPVAIVNASGISGRGSALEQVLVNMGVNVVQVTTATKDEVHSFITVVDDNAYTSKRIQKLLNFQGKESEGDGLSDIIIVIGKDCLSHPVF